MKGWFYGIYVGWVFPINIQFRTEIVKIIITTNTSDCISNVFLRFRTEEVKYFFFIDRSVWVLIYVYNLLSKGKHNNSPRGTLFYNILYMDYRKRLSRKEDDCIHKDRVLSGVLYIRINKLLYVSDSIDKWTSRS